MRDDDDDERRRERLAAYHGDFVGASDAARRVGWRGIRDQRLRFALCSDAAHDVARLASVLDVGCGEGDLAAFVRARGFTGEYVGIDLLDSMIAAAQQRHPRERFVTGDLLTTTIAPTASARFDLVVACGALSVRVSDDEAESERFIDAMLRRMWALTDGALAVVVPHVRARRGHHVAAVSGDDPFVYHSAEALRRRLSALSPWVVIREEALVTDLVGVVYRAEYAPAIEAQLERGELDAVGAAWLYLERSAPARALSLLEAQREESRSEWWLRRGQALRRTGHDREARQALEQALAIDSRCDEARLELEGV